MAKANKSRKTASTKMNQRSSRSHGVLIVTVTQTSIVTLDNGEEVKEEIEGKLHLVDLAGSERVEKTGATG